MGRCRPGFYDVDARSDNGCEYGCTIDLSAPEETCDGRDNNCDGQIDEGLELNWYRDQDRDGIGNIDVLVTSCLRPEGFVASAGDCDDEDPQRYPGRMEICDGLDNDCDEAIDEDALRSYFVDADGDGFGDPTRSTIRCAPAPGEVPDGSDCDDNNPERHPGKLEVCDGLDNNCLEGLADEPYQDFYRDDDGDAFGRDEELTKACRRPEDYALDGGDCDDSDRDRHPAAAEICDGIDNNCNDAVDDGLALQEMFADVDGDGFGDENAQGIQACLGTPLLAPNNTDCDDTDASRFPGAPEWCDGIDQDCDQIADNDVTLRSEAPVDLGSIGGTIASLRADSAELRWSDRIGGDPNARIMRRSFDANEALEFNGAGDIAPLSLDDFGQSSGLLGQSADRCQLQINGAAWTPFGPVNCRPMAVCPLPANGGQNFWVVILAVSDNGQETAGLYTVDHQAQSSLLNSLGSGSLVSHAECDGERFLALSVLQNNKDNLYAGPVPSPALREYNTPLRGIDLMVNDQGILLAVTRSDGVVEVEALSAQGASLGQNLLVGAPKQAGTARLVDSPSGAVLAYPVLEPAFERGIWATPIDVAGAPSGAQQRLTTEPITQNPTQITQRDTVGMGNLYYVGATNMRKLFLGCAPP
jgi:hypothetical protein